MTWFWGRFYKLTCKESIQLEFTCEREIVKVLCVCFLIHFPVLLYILDERSVKT